MAKKRILVSVTDKTGLVGLRPLLDVGYEFVSTGGTARALEGLGIPCIPIEDVTGFPEMLDGRLKTLHPKIHGGILADREKPEHMQMITDHGITPIDIVVVNLYDFDGNPGIEQIDIGGPTLLRAAAKNGASVIPLVDPADYSRVVDWLIQGRSLMPNHRALLVLKVFEHTAAYDRAISCWMHERITLGEPFWWGPGTSGH